MPTAENFYEFLNERENIKLRKLSGRVYPWTSDLILQKYKFTNVKRYHDKTTQKLCELFYENPKYKDLEPKYHFLNCVLFRLLGRWETCQELGYQTEYNPEAIRKFIKGKMERKETVYTGAYIIPAYGSKKPKIDIILDRTVSAFWEKVDGFVELIQEGKKWKPLFESMASVEGFGGSQFILKEVLLDTILTPMWGGEEPKDCNVFCPVGPGAERGLNRLAGREYKKRNKFETLLQEMKDLFTQRYEYLPRNLAESLVLHDIQFQLCEFDKYQRVLLGQGRPRSLYRVK